MTPLIEPGRYSCPACERRFAKLADKKMHVRQQHREQPTKNVNS